MLALTCWKRGSMDMHTLSDVIPTPPGFATRRAFGSQAVRTAAGDEGIECTPEVPFPTGLYI